MEIIRLAQAIAQDNAGREPDKEQHREVLFPIEARRKKSDAAQSHNEKDGEAQVKNSIASRQTEQRERISLQGDEKEHVEGSQYR